MVCFSSSLYSKTFSSFVTLSFSISSFYLNSSIYESFFCNCGSSKVIYSSCSSFIVEFLSESLGSAIYDGCISSFSLLIPLSSISFSVLICLVPSGISVFRSLICYCKVEISNFFNSRLDLRLCSFSTL